MMKSAVARVKYIKTDFNLRYHTQGVSNQVSSNSDHKIKSYSYSNSSAKIGITKIWEKIFCATKWANKWITNRGRL